MKKVIIFIFLVLILTMIKLDGSFKLSSIESIAISSKLQSFNQTKYVESVYIYDDNGLILKTDKIIEKKLFDKKVKQHKEKFGKNSQIVELEEIILASIGPGFEFDDSEGGTGISPTVTKTKFVSTTYKIYNMVATYNPSVGVSGEFEVTTTLTWVINPQMRLLDFISIGFLDNVQLESACFNQNIRIDRVNNQCPSGTQEYPDITAKFSFKKSYESNYVQFNITNHQRVVNGSHYQHYSYDLSKSFLGVDFELPVDTNVEGGGSGGGSTIYYIHENYYDFKIELRAIFTPTVNSLNGTTFVGLYAHQIGLGTFDWGSVSITPVYPYFSYSTSLFVDDPEFDAGIGGTIIFSNLS
ncbi:hypothetical protein [Paracholeplasma manati]|uniref:hypothetical protein n=1 Tax=Paracholeplasma manati TaxID=591373 RepID=UPI0024079B06|nr:hypothetical protein [Paracholeplasma manati]MDG0889146.1 hypothetical protein [Paracholeplasma manati]